MSHRGIEKDLASPWLDCRAENRARVGAWAVPATIRPMNRFEVKTHSRDEFIEVRNQVQQIVKAGPRTRQVLVQVRSEA